MEDGLRAAIKVVEAWDREWAMPKTGEPVDDFDKARHAVCLGILGELRKKLADVHREANVRLEPEAGKHYCDRCSGEIVEYRRNAGTTYGFYDVTGPNNYWSRFARNDEREVCDCCMWCDPRYLAERGQMTHEVRRENRPPTLDEAISDSIASLRQCSHDMKQAADELRVGGADEVEINSLTRCQQCATATVLLDELQRLRS